MIKLMLLAAALSCSAGACAADLASAKRAFQSGEQGWPHAIAGFRAAAGKGDGPAAYYLALMHRNGMGTARDSVRAAELMSAAARAGVPAAMFMLSNMLRAGEGVAADESAARMWLERAADSGHAEALQQMALAVGDGTLGFERDEQRAAHLMKEMAHAMRHPKLAP